MAGSEFQKDGTTNDTERTLSVMAESKSRDLVMAAEFYGLPVKLLEVLRDLV